MVNLAASPQSTNRQSDKELRSLSESEFLKIDRPWDEDRFYPFRVVSRADLNQARHLLFNPHHDRKASAGSRPVTRTQRATAQKATTMDNRLYTFIAGNTGPWSITKIHTVIGQALETASRLDIQNTEVRELPPGSTWLLRGATSNQRYVTRPEQSSLVASQAGLGRLEASCAALIPITKTPAWWALTQDERREIFESRSSHIALGLRYLPAIARRLHHGRDLGEPFDFLTWFEYAPSDATAFDDLVAALRATEEWNYVEREVDIRLIRSDSSPASVTAQSGGACQPMPMI